MTSKLIVNLQGAIFTLAAMAAAAAPASPEFAREIRPLLNKHCAECHGGVKQKGGLNLANRARALEGGKSGGQLLVAGAPAASELVRRIIHQSGMWFSDLLPNIATCADDLCMIRSLHTTQFQATLPHLFGLDHLRLTYRHGGADQRLTSLTRESRVVTDWFA